MARKGTGLKNLEAHRKATLFDCWPEEKKMCKAFMRQVHQQVAFGKMDKGSVIHVPNGQRAGRDRTARAIAGAEARDMGALAGCPDYLVRLPGGRIGWLEAKKHTYAEDGTVTKTYLSDNQKWFREDAIRRGEPCEVFRTPNEGIDWLKKWGVCK